MTRAVITQAKTPADLKAVRNLCWNYRSFMLKNSATDRRVTETFYPVPKYEALMEDLPREHARPRGIILLGHLDGLPVACGMTHALDRQISEMKRVFVSDAARGKGVAAQLCAALMDQARADGFSTMVLDTTKTLTGAQRLYAKLGFSTRAPYQPVPQDVLPDLLFYEATL